MTRRPAPKSKPGPEPPSQPARDRDDRGRPRNARPRDGLGRPLPRADEPTGQPPDPPALPPRQALDRAQVLLDSGRPFEAHEVLEAVWKAPTTPDGERELWRALAQLAVGITHARRGNQPGAVALLLRAAGNLEAFAGTSPHLVDADGLRRWAEAAAKSAQAPDVPRSEPQPEPSAALVEGTPPRLRRGRGRG